ncbi:hypothetical protein D3C77_716000 [compost metagenome]
MYLLALAQVFLGNAGEQLLAHLRRNRLDAFDQRTRRRAEQDELGAAVLERSLTMNQPLRFKAVQQTGQCRPFDGDALRQLALGG